MADIRRELWVHERRPEGLEVVGAVRPLNFASLPTVTEESWHGAPAGTTIGHIHFYAGDLPTMRDFYHAALGFDISGWTLPGALFFSVGGYHHHVGLNIWAARSPQAGDSDARILFWELVLPDAETVAETSASLSAAGFPAIGNTVVDPWGIRMALVAEA